MDKKQYIIKINNLIKLYQDEKNPRQKQNYKNDIIFFANEFGKKFFNKK